MPAEAIWFSFGGGIALAATMADDHGSLFSTVFLVLGQPRTKLWIVSRFS